MLWRAVLVVVAAARAMETATLRLRYFDARGAAELSRVMLHAGGVDFEDERWSIDFDEGMRAPGFEAAKAAGGLDANLGRAPVLDAGNGVVVGQSRAIERFVARRCGFLGGDDAFAAARIDCVAEHVRDVQAAQRDKGFSPFSQKTAAERDAARDEWYATDLPAWLAKLDGAVGGGGFAVGGKRSYADFALWALLRDGVRDAADDAAATADALAKAPNLRAIVDAVEGDAAVAAWVARRPATRF